MCEQLHRIRQNIHAICLASHQVYTKLKIKGGSWDSVSSCRLTHGGGIVGIHEQGCVADLKALGLSKSKSLHLNENHFCV